MQTRVISRLFGLDIHYPFIRTEVREVVKKQAEYRKKIIKELSLTPDQAVLEVIDIFNNFFSEMTNTERLEFEKLHAEEVGAAPSNWFSDEEEIDNTLLESGSTGTLFGIDVAYPFTRENIRKIVKSRHDLMKSISKENNISLYQASNDLDDIQASFLERLSLNDQERFLNLSTEETLALTKALNDETAKINQEIIEQEASNAHIAGVIASVIGFICVMFLFYVVFK